MQFPSYVDLIFNIFHQNNFSAYLVGGAVRDFFMQKISYDFDFTTNALPCDIKRIFSGFKILDYGEKYGTIAVIIDENVIEITTFRGERKYLDNRHPDVFFTDSLAEDLKRRDFTINSICMDKDYNVIDLFGGIDDIKNKIIRTIGNREDRFSEDALRILRAIRFSSTLGFEIEDETFLAMKNNLELLNNISSERKFDEFSKCILGDNIGNTMKLYPEIFAAICPEILDMKGFLQNNPYHLYDVLEHSILVVDKTPSDLITRIASFFHDTGKVYTYSFKNNCGHFYNHGKFSQKIAKRDLQKLKVSNKILNDVLLLIKYHDCTVYPEKKDVKIWLNKIGEELLFKLFDLQIADTLAKSKKAMYKLDMIENARKIAYDVITNNECYCIKQLAINGYDVQNLGFSGPKIKQVLSFVLDSVICGKVSNTKDEIIELIKKEISHF